MVNRFRVLRIHHRAPRRFNDIICTHRSRYKFVELISPFEEGEELSRALSSLFATHHSQLAQMKNKCIFNGLLHQSDAFCNCPQIIFPNANRRRFYLSHSVEVTGELC
ncbi:hypothetical protein NPIL_544201 [Nephila pilipes]|uniref:Uncharacterized protein n=1 Tax=Nephila pilipes TaxID=299642 RepID=A0A8X6PPA2_NEPPI|nr:hypothetical protein NPIL_544201 [Nephila pilipes]